MVPPFFALLRVLELVASSAEELVDWIEEIARRRRQSASELTYSLYQTFLVA
jgi:hypothetical protein